MYGSRSLVAELSAVDGESVGRHVSNIGCQRVSDIVRHNEKRRYLKLSERNNVALHTQWQAEEWLVLPWTSELLSSVMLRTRVTLQLSDLEF